MNDKEIGKWLTLLGLVLQAIAVAQAEADIPWDVIADTVLLIGLILWSGWRPSRKMLGS
ncbi:MAG: hypothetical protein JRM78_04235 [Nitrososphaerota archaeon]|jgi:hypothetical protein|nr:hypothetical protein [Nitrososphaerota archaeon]